MVRHDTNKKWFFNIIPSTTGGVKTPSKLSFDITQGPNVIWKWNFAQMIIFYDDTLCLKKKLETR